MLLVALIVSLAWVSRQGSRRAAPAAPSGSTAATAPRAAAPPRVALSRASSVVPAPERPAVPSAPAVVARGANAGPANATPSAGAAPPPAPSRSGPEIVPTKPLERARQAISSGSPDEAIALLRTNPPSTDPAVKGLLIEALVASGTKAVNGYHWQVVARRAREALALADPGTGTHGAHGLLGDALVAFNDLEGAVAEYQRALAETPRDARMRRHLLRARLQLQARASAAATDRSAGGGSAAGAKNAASTSTSTSSSASGEPAAE